MSIESRHFSVKGLVDRFRRPSGEIVSSEQAWADLVAEKMEKSSSLAARFVNKKRDKSFYGYFIKIVSIEEEKRPDTTIICIYPHLTFPKSYEYNIDTAVVLQKDQPVTYVIKDQKGWVVNPTEDPKEPFRIVKGAKAFDSNVNGRWKESYPNIDDILAALPTK